jgi:hypothetical protein
MVRKKRDREEERRIADEEECVAVAVTSSFTI